MKPVSGKKVVRQRYLPWLNISVNLRNSLTERHIQGVTDDSGTDSLVRT